MSMNQTDTGLIDTHGSFPSHKSISDSCRTCSLPRLVIACRPIGVTFDRFRRLIQMPCTTANSQVNNDGLPNYLRGQGSVSVFDETYFDLN